MGKIQERLHALYHNRWLVFVAAIWIQSWSGIGYMFGSISPVLKSSLSYNQRQVASLGVAKDLGDSVGFFAGSLSEVLPLWGMLLVGSVQNLVGYGWVWLIVTGRAPRLPLWMMWILIFVGTNGETYFNTTSLVSCIQNFPKSRGPIVGILKGFTGLSGAIINQIYALLQSSNHANLLLMVAIGPTVVVLAFMFVVRPVAGHRQVRSSDSSSFMFIYSVCMVLAAYLMGIMLLEDQVEFSYNMIIVFTCVLFFLLILPIVIPVILTFTDPHPEEEPLLPDPQKVEAGKSGQSSAEEKEVILSEVEDEKPKEVDLLPAVERQKRIAHLQARLLQAAADGAVRVKRKRGPRRGENFTLMQALVKADFWLMFLSLLLGSGSGLTVIDNLGQMSESLGYNEPHIFVSMISIWNFVGRVGGGYLSEIIVRDKALPRHLALAVAQVLMAFGHFLLAMGWPGTMYFSTLLVGLGFGAHWAIVPAAASELFGLKNFGVLYNFLTVANPAGTLIFAGLLASSIYDYEAAKQNNLPHTSFMFSMFSGGNYGLDQPPKCMGTVCFFLTSLIMCSLCFVAMILSMILVYRTKTVYASLYGKSQP